MPQALGPKSREDAIKQPRKRIGVRKSGSMMGDRDRRGEHPDGGHRVCGSLRDGGAAAASGESRELGKPQRDVHANGPSGGVGIDAVPGQDKKDPAIQTKCRPLDPLAPQCTRVRSGGLGKHRDRSVARRFPVRVSRCRLRRHRSAHTEKNGFRGPIGVPQDRIDFGRILAYRENPVV